MPEVGEVELRVGVVPSAVSRHRQPGRPPPPNVSTSEEASQSVALIEGDIYSDNNNIIVYQNLRRGSVPELSAQEWHRLIEKRQLRKKEENPSPYTPSLGIELEVHSKAVTDTVKNFAYEKSVSLSPAWRELSARYGIKRDIFDPIPVIELNIGPVSNYELISRQVQELYRLGLLNPEHRISPLHLNVGGINKDRDALLFHQFLSSTGWTTTGKRLSDEGPYDKGRMGLYFKYKTLNLPKVEGIPQGDPRNIEVVLESRTHSLGSLSGLNRTLKTAFMLGTALKAYQKPVDDRDEIENSLAEVWSGFRDDYEALMKEFGVGTETYDYIRGSNPIVKGYSMSSIGSRVVEAWQSRQAGNGNDDFLFRTRYLAAKARKDVSDILYSERQET